jgi:hypothetical protein
MTGETEASIAIAAVVVVGLVIFMTTTRRAPTYQPSPAAPIAPPEPDLPRKCGYFTKPSAITGVTQREYVCCHPRQPTSGAAAGAAVGAKAGKYIPVPILGPLVGMIFGEGFGSFFSKGNCADTDADQAAAIAAGWGT